MPPTFERLPGDDGDDLSGHPIEVVRALRGGYQQAEVGLSYLRRVVHGRLDIVGAELRRRAQGGTGADLASLVDDLPGILAEHDVRAAGPGRLPTLMAPGDDDARSLQAELDAVVDPGRMASVTDLDDADVHGLLDALAAFERDVSERRHRVHERIDALQAELTRRYKSGDATVDTLLS